MANSEEIKWVVTADDKDIIAAFKRMQKELEATKQKMREQANESGKAQKQSESWLKSQGSDLQGMVAGWVSVTQAISVVTSAYQKLRQETQALGEAHRKLSGDTVRAISRSGDLANAQQIESAIGSVKGATREQAQLAFEGISQAAPGMNLDRRLAIMREVAPLAASGADVGQMGNIAAKIGNILPGKSANDIVDITAAMRQRLGEDFARVGGDEFELAMARLVQTGMNPEQAAAIGLAGVEQNMPSKSINAIMTALSDQQEFTGQAKTKEERLKRKFFKSTDPNERFRMLASDPATAQAVLGAKGAVDMSLIGDTSAQQKFLNEAQTADFAASQLRQLGSFPAGREAVRQQETAVLKDQLTRGRAAEEAQLQRAADFARSVNANTGAIGRARVEGEIMSAEHGFSVRSGKTSAESMLKVLENMGYMTEQQVKSFERQERQNTEMIVELKRLTTQKQKNIDRNAEQ